jgi:hypothetical protein
MEKENKHLIIEHTPLIRLSAESFESITFTANLTNI